MTLEWKCSVAELPLFIATPAPEAAVAADGTRVIISGCNGRPSSADSFCKHFSRRGCSTSCFANSQAAAIGRAPTEEPVTLHTAGMLRTGTDLSPIAVQ